MEEAQPFIDALQIALESRKSELDNLDEKIPENNATFEAAADDLWKHSR